MANKTTHLDTVKSSAFGKEATINATDDANSPGMLFGRRASSTTGLTWGFYGGTMLIAGVPTTVNNNTVTATALGTNYWYSNGDGTTTITTSMPTGWPGPLDGNKKALYTLTVGSSTITDWQDHRTDNGLGRNVTRVGTMAYAASLTLDWSKYDVIRVTLTGNCTFTHSGAADGEMKTLELTQDATGSRIGSWTSEARFSTTVPSPTLTTTASKMDRLIWQRASTKYDLLQVNKSY
jgi:hypothetical protein